MVTWGNFWFLVATWAVGTYVANFTAELIKIWRANRRRPFK